MAVWTPSIPLPSLRRKEYKTNYHTETLTFNEYVVNLYKAQGSDNVDDPDDVSS